MGARIMKHQLCGFSSRFQCEVYGREDIGRFRRWVERGAARLTREP